MLISVIFTTYNSPAWLEKVLWGFHAQSDRGFEIVIADDGSGEETKWVIDRFKSETDLEIKHVWQPDDGFRKCKILNKALLAADGEYFIVTDGDCIPRHDFVIEHRHHAEPGCYLSGGYFKLPMVVSEAIRREDIESGRCFQKSWLISKGVPLRTNFLKLSSTARTAPWLNRLTLTRKTWNGHNASGWLSDALRVNGFDERMRYGGEDCEFGDRLVNSGIRPKQVRYSAITVHLDHTRGYVSEADWANNRLIRRATQLKRTIETPNGIRQL